MSILARVTWSLIRAVIEQTEGHNINMEVKTIQSLHEYELKEQDMQGALKRKNVMLNQTQSLEKQLRDIYIYTGYVKTEATWNGGHFIQQTAQI